MQRQKVKKPKRNKGGLAIVNISKPLNEYCIQETTYVGIQGKKLETNKQSSAKGRCRNQRFAQTHNRDDDDEGRFASQKTRQRTTMYEQFANSVQPPGMENSSYYEGFGSANIRSSDSEIVARNYNQAFLIPRTTSTKKQEQNHHNNFSLSQHSTIMNNNQLLENETRSSVVYESKKLSASQIQQSHLLSQKFKPFQAACPSMRPQPTQGVNTMPYRFQAETTRTITINQSNQRNENESVCDSDVGQKQAHQEQSLAENRYESPSKIRSPIKISKNRTETLQSQTGLISKKQQESSMSDLHPNSSQSPEKQMNKADRLRLQQAIIKTATECTQNDRRKVSKEPVIASQHFLATPASTVYNNAHVKQQLQVGATSLNIYNSLGQDLGTTNQPNSVKLAQHQSFKRRNKRINHNSNSSYTNTNNDQFVNSASLIQRSTFQQKRESRLEENMPTKSKLQLVEIQHPNQQKFTPPRTAGSGTEVINVSSSQPYGLLSPPIAKRGTDATTVCNATLLATPTGYAHTAAVMLQMQQQPVVPITQQIFQHQVNHGRTTYKVKAQNRIFPKKSKYGSTTTSLATALHNSVPQGNQLVQDQYASFTSGQGHPLFTQTPATTAVLVPTASLGASNLPQNGYLLGYVNQTMQNGQPVQQVLVPTTMQPVFQREREFNTTGKHKGRNSTTQEHFYSANGNHVPFRSQDNRVPGDHNLMQLFLEENAQLQSSRESMQNSVDDIYSADGIKIRGQGVSAQIDRSPTEMLRRVVRLRGQSKVNDKIPSNSQFVNLNSKFIQPPQSMAGTELQVLQNQMMAQSQMQQHSVLSTLSQEEQQPPYFMQSNQNQGQQFQYGSQIQLNTPRMVVLTVEPPRDEQEQASIEKEKGYMKQTNPISQKRAGQRISKKPSHQAVVNSRNNDPLNQQKISPSSCLVGQSVYPTVQTANSVTNSSRQIQQKQNVYPPSRSGSNSAHPRIRKIGQPTSPNGNLSVHTAAMYVKKGLDINSEWFQSQLGQGSQPPPCIIVQIFQPPSALRLVKEIQRITHMVSQFKEKPQVGVAQDKKTPIDLTLNLRDHPINVCLRKANEFSQETFLKPNDKEIDLKKVQQLCNFFKIAMPHRVSSDLKRLKAREFQIGAKERILICLYETVNKENGMVRPDMPTRVPAQQRPTDTFGEASANTSFLGQNYGRGEIVRGDTTKELNKEETPKDQQQQFLVNPYQPNQRKFYIARGNNHGIVRIVFKQRWWWQMTTRTLSHEVRPASFENNHFLWTQWRKDHLIDQLPTFKKKCDQAKAQIQQQQMSAKNGTQDLPGMGPERMCLYAKMEANYHLSNKKALFWNMTNYYKKQGRDPFESLPLTFHVENGLNDQEFRNFQSYYQHFELNIRNRKEKLNQLIKEAKKYNKKNQTFEKVQSSIQKDPICSSNNKQSNVPKIPPVADQAYLLEPYDPENLSYFEDESIQAHYNISVGRNIWIIKPGENSNRGCGIYVCGSLQEIAQEVKQSARAGNTLIIQKYIDRPLLFAARKFDIRMFAVLSSINSQVKGYVYSDGYLRTSCKEFSLDNLSSRFVHLTNDAIQQTSDEYGRFESGNKISFQQFQRYLDHAFPDKKINVNKDLMPQITRLVTDSFYATFSKIDPLRRQNSFEIFGYDFMIDSDFKVYIIECNTNPCLELSCPLMARIIPAMLDNVFRVVVDPLFPPPDFSMAKKNLMHDILPISKLELVFDERLSGNHCRELSGDDPKLNLRIQDDEGNNEEEEIEEESEGMEEELDDLPQVGDFVESASGGSARST